MIPQDFQLSSDGSTWDQTGSAQQPPGVDWGQYDEEMSGQPSLLFVEQQADVVQAETPAALSDVDDDRRRFSSDDARVADSSAPAAPVDQLAQDGAYSDEGFGVDEADFTCDASSGYEAAPRPSESEAGPGVHWNLHAPEFQFRTEQSAEPEQSLESPSPVPVAAPERKLSATEMLIRSSNDAQLAVLLAAANDDPDEAEPHDELLDLEPISPRSDLLDDTQNAGQEANGTFLVECYSCFRFCLLFCFTTRTV